MHQGRTCRKAALAFPAMAWLLSGLPGRPPAAAIPDSLLFDFTGSTLAASVQTVRAEGYLTVHRSSRALRIDFAAASDTTAGAPVRPRFALVLPPFDLSRYREFAVDVSHVGGPAGRVAFTLDDRPGSRTALWLEPGETRTLRLPLFRARTRLSAALQQAFPALRALPAGFAETEGGIGFADPAALSRLEFSVAPGATADGGVAGFSIAIDNLRASGEFSPLPDSVASNPLADFFPFIDAFGQFRHRDWPGKTLTPESRATAAAAEAASPFGAGPEGRDRFGGYAAGPSLQATGHFRADTLGGRHWLVTPDGTLFWSLGLCGVSLSQPTGALGHTHWFEALPPVSADGRTDFLLTNAVAKWGDLASAKAAVYARLRRWGMNTLGTGSSADFTLDARVPYTVSLTTPVSRTSPRMDDTAAIAAGMRLAFQRDAALIASCEADAFCLGYFVDGGLDFLATLPPSETGFHAERYYRLVAATLRQVAPQKLYLGSRLTWPRAAAEAPSPSALAWLRAAEAHCDVVSLEPFGFSVAGLGLPDSVAKPLLISGFGFGALDRGLDHPGKLSASSQEQRARLFAALMRDAAADRRFVGAHWFQYADQPYSGTAGGALAGASGQTGFVDIVDRPYPELEAAARAVAGELYADRLAGRRGNSQTVFIARPGFGPPRRIFGLPLRGFRADGRRNLGNTPRLK